MFLMTWKVDDQVKMVHSKVSALKISPMIEHILPLVAFLYDASAYTPGLALYILVALFPVESPIIAKIRPIGPQQ